MSNFQKSIAKAVSYRKGSSFWRTYTLTSSNIKTATKGSLTPAATGKLFIRECIVKTDGTGLAGGTNFELLTTNAKGVANFFVETVANLGANVTKVMTAGGDNADTTTSDARPSVTALPTVLEAGKKIQYDSTSADCTGAGTIDIHLEFVRLDDGADIPDSN